MARGDIVYIDFPQSPRGTGHEQVGRRPALVVHDDATSATLTVIMVVPFTGNLAAQRFPHTIVVDPSSTNGLTGRSVLLVFQLRAIDRRRIGNAIGCLDPQLMNQVDAEMRCLLGL